MKNSQSKFSNKKSSSGMESHSPKSSSTASCCGCGSKMSEGIDEVDIVDVEEE